MNLEWLILQMSEEERNIFFETDCAEYYQYVMGMDEFLKIQEKLQQQETLQKEEWKFVITKLFLVYCHFANNTEEMDMSSRFLFHLSKLGIKMAKDHGPLYNECYKLCEFIGNYQRVEDLFSDLLNGIKKLICFHQEEDLVCLLEQYQTTNLFLNSKKAYEDSYRNTIRGELSPNEKLYIHATHHAYDEEKKLVKRYERREK